MAPKKKASVRGEKRFRPKRPRSIRVTVHPADLGGGRGPLFQTHPSEFVLPDPIVPMDIQEPPPLRDRTRDHLWKL
jgi:hypothetical protein